jgi:transcriptional regulator with XRE-family HTH domain
VIEAREFGASLRRERERRGISLDEIAEQTKVSASVLSGLERGDLSRWPAGIFRRAFVRSYAKAVGLDVEETLAEFLRVFPEDGQPSRSRWLAPSTHSMRLSLGDAPDGRVDWRRLQAAAIDAFALAALAAGLWYWRGPEVALVGAVAFALVWHGLACIAWGETPGLRLVSGRWRPVPVRTEASRAAAAVSIEDDAEAAPDAALRLQALPPPPPGRGRLARRDRRAATRADRAHGSDSRLPS